MAKIHGKWTKVTFGGTDLLITSFDFEDDYSLQEVTDSGSNGRAEYMSGIQRTTFSFEGNWDAAVNTGDPPKPFGGEPIEIVVEYRNSSEALVTATFTGLIGKCGIKSATDSHITYSGDGNVSGAVVWS